MSVKQLPARPNLEYLKKEARALLRAVQASDGDAEARMRRFKVAAAPRLADALFVLAREYGFESWSALKLHVQMESAGPEEALTATIKADDAEQVREVLRRFTALKTRLNEPLQDYSFDTPALVAAVQNKNRRMVDVLLEAGADVNARTRWWAGGFGVLDFAGPELAAYLIGRGATVDLHAAARLGRIDRVRELLARDPQAVHARGGDGQLPLHFAATVEIAETLLDAGAEIDARDLDHESTAAQYMVSARPYRHDVARFLIARGAKTDILMASALGDEGLVERILNDDPDMVRVTVSERHFPKQNPRAGGSIYIFGFGWTKSAHIIAREFGHSEVFALLMLRSPVWLRLLNAAEAGDEAYFRRILTEHPQLLQKLSANAARRIIGVATRNNTKALGLLIHAGWPAGAAMEAGQTALHFAAWHGNVEAVRHLLAHGASVHAVEVEHGGTPLGWALHGSLHSGQRDKGDYPAVVRALMAADADATKLVEPQEATEELLEVLRAARLKR